MYLSTDVEGIHAPEQYARAIYNAFNVAMDKKTELYYKECAQVGNKNNFIEFYIERQKYQLDEKYLFSPVSFYTLVS